MALKPAETRMMSGSNSRQIGITIERKAARYSASPKLDTGGKGRERQVMNKSAKVAHVYTKRKRVEKEREREREIPDSPW